MRGDGRLHFHRNVHLVRREAFKDVRTQVTCVVKIEHELFRRVIVGRFVVNDVARFHIRNGKDGFFLCIVIQVGFLPGAPHAVGDRTAP